MLRLPAIFLFGCVLVVGCGGGSSTLTPFRATASATPASMATSPGDATIAAAIAAITPAPGYPSAPPVGATFGPGSGATATDMPFVYPSSTPVPAPTGSDLATLEAGGNPPLDYVRSLERPITPELPLADSAPKAVFGTITGFAPPAGIVVSVAPPFDPSQSAANPLLAGANAESAATITAQLSGNVYDFVAGGLGTLKIGSSVIVSGSGPASAFQADAVTAFGPARSAGTASVARTSDAIARQTEGRPAVSARKRFANVSNATTFSIARSFGMPALVYPNPPLDFVFASSGCIDYAITLSASSGGGEMGNFPMELDDVSTPETYVESSPQPLPVRLVNGASTGNTTYSINYGSSVSGGIYQTFQRCKFVGPIAKTYPLSFTVNGTVGQGISSSTTGPLPGTGGTLQVAHMNCPFISLSGGGVLAFIVNDPISPSLSICFDLTLSGAPVVAQASMTNAQVNDPDGSFDETSMVSNFPWSSDLPVGDPMENVIPLADPATGKQLPNTLDLTSLSYNGNLVITPSLQLSALLRTVELQLQAIPKPTVFQNAGLLPFTPITDVSDPIFFSLKLQPSNGIVTVIGI